MSRTLPYGCTCGRDPGDEMCEPCEADGRDDDDDDSRLSLAERLLLRKSLRDQRQAKIFAWAKQAFPVDQVTSLSQRGLRLLEEAIEAFQAVGGEAAMAHRLVDYVFDRPVGELHQELGGVGISLLVLAAAAGLSADEAEDAEARRVLSKPIAEFRARNAAKITAGFLVAGLAKEDSEG